MVNHYCLQHRSFALGNFINCTPTLKALAEYLGKPYPVFFETDYVKECFIDCPFIEIIDKPGKHHLFGSYDINREEPDYKYIYKRVRTNYYHGLPKEIPHTYVDTPRYDLPVKKPFAVVMNGCGTEQKTKVDQKNPGADIYIRMIKKIAKVYDVVFVGSLNDRKRNPWIMGMGMTISVGNIRKALSYIEQSDFVIANDTGLYHAAGAMKKKGFVIWKDTLYPKNATPNVNFKTSFKNNWQTDFDKWLTTI